MDVDCYRKLSKELLRSAMREIRMDKIVVYPWRFFALDDEAFGIIETFLRDHFPEVGISILTDFRRRNEGKIRLDEIFGPLEWPQSEFERHTVVVSAPGFSEDATHAILFIGTYTGSLSAFGECCLYSKDSTEWIKQTMLTALVA